MKRVSQIVCGGFLGSIVLIGFLTGSCAAPGPSSVNTPESSRANYPPSIEESAERREEVQQAWKNFLSESNLPFSELELEPVLDTPRAMPSGLSGQISITKISGALKEMEAKEALRGFIDRTRGILAGDPKNSSITIKDLSLVSFTDDGTFYRATYQQATYQFPIANGYGELRLTVGKNGKLLQWSSTLLPQFDLSIAPEVKPADLAARLINSEFEYSDFAGQRQRYRVTKREEIVFKNTLIFPKLNGDKISVHLAYAFEVGSGMTWTVYFDAINGLRLGEKQNFAT